jgi:hypothetical protein
LWIASNRAEVCAGCLATDVAVAALAAQPHSKTSIKECRSIWANPPRVGGPMAIASSA